MKELELVSLAILVSATGAATSLAQTMWWRIMNGPGGPEGKTLRDTTTIVYQ